MSDRPISPSEREEVPPEVVSGEPTEPTQPESNEITTGRRMLWMVGGGVGAYMILRGVWGLMNDEDEQERP